MAAGKSHNTLKNLIDALNALLNLCLLQCAPKNHIIQKGRLMPPYKILFQFCIMSAAGRQAPSALSDKRYYSGPDGRQQDVENFNFGASVFIFVFTG